MIIRPCSSGISLHGMGFLLGEQFNHALLNRRFGDTVGLTYGKRQDVGIVHHANTNFCLPSILQLQTDPDNDGVVRAGGLSWQSGGGGVVWPLVF